MHTLYSVMQSALTLVGEMPHYKNDCYYYYYDYSNMPNLPMAPKKSLPRNGKPGRLAKTIMRKSGCDTMTVSLAGIPEVAVGQTIQN